ncbi:hypothetical protein ACU5EH_15085 [Aliivibrio salmonicida]|uniref:hypothetical protein n=1 Tax=Aliivibrio salmonicida TaxID=40269 RepID=UPI00406CEF63
MSDKSKKYKYTRQLLKVATDNGNYRNEDIALKAGLSGKSVAQVSAWRNGRKDATERQMGYFIREYEHLLKQKMEHLFYSMQITNGVNEPIFTKLSGEIVFKQQIKVNRNNRILKNKKDFSVLRIIVLKDNHHFHLLCQYRAGLLSMKEQDVDGNMQCVFSHITTSELVYSDNEDGNWYCYDVKRQQNLNELVESIQCYCQNLIQGKSLLDSIGRSNIPSSGSLLFTGSNVYSLELAFYQKMMKLGLSCDSFPF